MEIKFEPVRIGKFRKDIMQEKVLKQNYTNLKSRLKDFVKSIPCVNVENTIDVDIVIPARGSRITITLDAVKDKEIKKQLITNFPDSIYKGDYSILIKNSLNRPYFPLNI